MHKPLQLEHALKSAEIDPRFFPGSAVARARFVCLSSSSINPQHGARPQPVSVAYYRGWARFSIELSQYVIHSIGYLLALAYRSIAL